MASFRLKRKDIQDKTIKELTDEYILYLQANQRSKWTIRTYNDKFKLFLEFVGDNTLLKNITTNTIEKYQKELLKTNRATSVNTHLTHLKSSFKYANKKGYMSKISINKLEAQEKIKGTYSKEDLIELLREEPRESFMRYQSRIIIATFVSTGLRLSELISLQVRDVDFDNMVIYSRHTKTRKARILPISSSLKVLLLEWVNNRQYTSIEDSLFCNSYGEEMKVAGLRTLMFRYFQHKGVENHGIHQFRRTFITNSVNNNVDIVTLSRITGHTNLKMLDKYYVNSTSRIKNVADRCSILEQLSVVPKVRKRLDKRF